MKDLSFTTFQDIATLAKGRKILLFGGGGPGSIADKTQRNLRDRPLFVVDNNQNMWDTIEFGVKVVAPTLLQNSPKNEYFTIICTMSFGDVGAQLAGFGLTPGVDYVVSPILNDLRVITQLEACKTKMLFTSGFPAETDPRWGGGIYELTLDGYSWEYRKVYSGVCYGVMKHEGGYVAVDDIKGVIRLDADYKLLQATELKRGTRAHGISLSEKTGNFYVASSNIDQVLVFNRKLDLVDSIPLSHKLEAEGSAQHHCNDICVIGNSAYVSMFSHTGSYKRGIFDGAVVEIDIPTKRVLGPVIRDLWMPHNVSFHDGNITVLDSLRGELKKYNGQPIGRFPGFSRGLDTDGAYYYIGQSRNRNYSKYLGLSMNISLDTSIIVFDEHTKVSRSLSLPSKLSEIHSILIL